MVLRGVHDTVASVQEGLSCSRGQETIWFAEEIADIGAANNVPLPITLRGNLDHGHLEAALSAVIDAQPALRTRFRSFDGRLLRTTLEAGQNEYPTIRTRRPADVEEFVGCRSAEPLRLVDQPMRFDLLRGAGGEHVLLCLFHRVVCDEHSTRFVVEDLTRAYEQAAHGVAPHLPTSASYDVHVADERAYVRTEAKRADLYWRAIVEALPESARWPKSPHAARPDVAQGSALRFNVEPTLKARLAAMARRYGSSLRMVLVAAVQTLQHVYAGRSQDPVATLVPLSTRSSSSGESIGMFSNDAPLVSWPSTAETFADLLEMTMENDGQRRTLRRFPFADAVANFGLGEDPWTLLPRVGVSFMKNEARDLHAGGVEFLADLLSPVYGRLWDVRFRFLDEPEALAVSLEFDSAAIHAEGAARLARHLGVVLERVAEAPTTRLATLGVLPHEERHRMLVTWNQSGERHPRDTLQQLFARQVDLRSHDDAVVAGDEVVSYRELDRRADRLAGRMIAAGLAPGNLVALHLQRSIATVASMLAVGKARAAFLPLDPESPQERIAFMLADSRASMLVTERPELLGPGDTPRIVMSEEDVATCPVPPIPRDSGRPEDLAYVIYTSGSTGRPKGAEILQSGLANVLQSTVREPGLTNADTQLAVASISFDLAILELLAPLAAGARVVVAPSNAAADGEALADLIRRWKVTYLHATPATWRLLVAGGWEGRIATAVSGGEALTPDLAELLLRRATNVWNSYGPTETAIASTFARVSIPDAISIGGPVSNTQLYVLDRAGQPAPLGATGELHIGGAGVARGYLHRPELTRDRFVTAAGLGRAYRTGDLVRQRDDGKLEYIGRTDDQVKIRGFRVELGEVEAAISALPEIREAAVVATTQRGTNRLVAYIVEERGSTVTIADVRNRLSRRLPEPMIPAVFAKLDELPVTRSGKIDRRRLPDPDLNLSQAEYVAPTTQLECLLAPIWANVLDVDRVGTEDNFFALGGHSLLAAEVTARSSRALGRSIPLRLVFEFPTVGRLARALDTHSATATQPKISRAHRRRLVS